MKKSFFTLAFFFFSTSVFAQLPIINKSTIFDPGEGGVVLHTPVTNQTSVTTAISSYGSIEDESHLKSLFATDLFDYQWETELAEDGKVKVKDPQNPFSDSKVTSDYQDFLALNPSEGHPILFNGKEVLVPKMRNQLYQSRYRLSDGRFLSFGGIEVATDEENGEARFTDTDQFFLKDGEIFTTQKICKKEEKCKNRYDGDGNCERNEKCGTCVEIDEDGEIIRQIKDPERETTLRQIPKSPEPLSRHLARFREIDGEIFMIGGWELSTTTAHFSNLGRSYKNEIRKLNREEISCPTTTLSTVSLLSDDGTRTYGEELSKSSWEKIEVSGLDGEVVDFFEVDGQKKFVVRKDDGIYIGDEKIDEKKFFFNSQMYCPTTDTCFYSISGGSKSEKFEDPRNLENYDFISRLKLFKVTSNSLEELDTPDLPRVKGYGTGRILHQVVLSGTESDLSLKLYGGYLVNQTDSSKIDTSSISTATEAGACDFLEGETNLVPDSVEKALCERNSDNKNDTCNNQKFFYNPSTLLGNDSFSYYELKIGENEWKKFNFFIGEVGIDETGDSGSFPEAEGKNKFYEYPLQTSFRSEINKIELAANNLEWAWHSACCYRCGRKCCKCHDFIRINGKTNIDLYYTYANSGSNLNGVQNNNLKLNFMPIQSFSNDNKLSFAGNFDFSQTNTTSSGAAYENNKKFIGAILLEEKKDGDFQSFLSPENLDKIFELKDNKMQMKQCLVEGAVANSCGELGDLSLPATPGMCQVNYGPSSKTPSYSNNTGPQIKADRNPQFLIDTGSTAFEVFDSNTDDTGEKGSFFLTKEFAPGWNRVHILAAAVANQERQSLVYQSDFGYGFFGKQPTWTWGHGRHDGMVAPGDVGAVADQVDFARIFYRAFVYEFYVPEVTNFTGSTKILGEKPAFYGRFVPESSQLFFYGSGGGLFRLNDLTVNQPGLSKEFDLNSSIPDPTVEGKTSNKAGVKNPIKLVDNSVFHHKVRASENLSSEIKTSEIGNFSYSSSFPFKKNQSYDFKYFYLDKDGNSIGGPPVNFELTENENEGKLILNENLIYNSNSNLTLETSSERPILNGNYKAGSDLRALILEDGSYFDEVFFRTDQFGDFSFSPNLLLDFSKNYSLVFSDNSGKKVSENFQIKFNEKTPPLIDFENGKILKSKRPTFTGEGKDGDSVVVRIFSEKQTDSSLDKIECLLSDLASDPDLKKVSCSNLGKIGTTNLFFSTTVTVEDGHWSVTLDKDLVSFSEDSKGIYFVKTNYLGKENFDLKSFRFLDGELATSTLTDGVSIEELGDQKKLTLKKDGTEFSFLDTGEIEFNGNFEIEIAPYGQIEFLNDFSLSFTKGPILQSGIYGNYKYLLLPGDLDFLEGDRFIAQNKAVKISGNGNLKLRTFGNLKVKNKSSSTLTSIFQKEKNFFLKEGKTKHYFDCKEVFDYGTSLQEKNPNLSLRSETDCLSALSSLYRESGDSSLALKNLKNGSVLKSEEIYTFYGTTSPSTKVSLNLNSKTIGSTSSDKNGDFSFTLAEGVEDGFFSTRTARLKLFSSEKEALSEEFLIGIKKDLGSNLEPASLEGNLDFDSKNFFLNTSFLNSKIPD